MKTILRLNNPLWVTRERRQLLDKIVQQSAAELESLIKQKVLQSRPAGRTYRRRAIRSRGVVTAYKFHRASAKGQPFANDTGATLNATRAKRIGPMKATVSNGLRHAEILDNPQKLDRPFFRSTAEKFRAKFYDNLREAIRAATAK